MKKFFSNTQTDVYNAKILQKLYIGENGELPNFLQFSYQQFCLLPFDTPLKKILEVIAQDDFLHTKILAEEMVKLGQTPLMQNCEGKFFSTKQIQTEICQQNMLLIDIEIKEKSIINYKSAIIKVNSKTIKNVLSKIVKEEEMHLQMLKNLQELLNASKI